MAPDSFTATSASAKPPKPPRARRRPRAPISRRCSTRALRRQRKRSVFMEIPMNQPTGPLAGIQVLDLTSVLFGPYAAQTLGDWGAEIIKVEPLTGDTWRYSGQFRSRGMRGQFMATTRNKRSLALDLKQPDGKAVLQRLIAKADVLVTNIRPAALARLGFGYA